VKPLGCVFVQKYAMQVVRTIGRAFDMCHQLLQQQQQSAAPKSPAGEAKDDADESDAVETAHDYNPPPPDTEQPYSEGLQLLVDFCRYVLN